ncbi:MAG: soluble starch synthase [Trebouxia sp. A1-2]|nr:MAG: soluble starch synthase [Trebouxia sp. A1-2]
MANAAALLQQPATSPSCKSSGSRRVKRLAAPHAERAVARLSNTETVAISFRRGNSLSKGFCAAAHPSTIEEHTKLGDAARAQSINRDTSDDFLQEETEHKRSHKAKTAFNIVFVTSEVSADILGTTVGFSHYSSKGVDWVFVEHGSYDRPGGLYGDESGGVYPPGTFSMLQLPKEWYNALEWQYPPHQRQGSYEEEGRCVNTMKAGISCADRVVTVSPGYAWEIQTPEGGWGMEGMLTSRSYALNGVLNGVDLVEWDPDNDPHIYQNFNESNFAEGKKVNKAGLQKEMGLPERPEVPIIGFIGRLDYQKGADLVLGAAHWLLNQDVQIICLGTGDKHLEAGMRWLESAYPDKARGWVGFNVPMSHKITAACDLLLMPSRFEPCGLNQLYAMRYGTVPVAHATGGLRDTVLPFNPWEVTGTGWTFSPCTVDAFTATLGQALDTYRNHTDSFRDLQSRGMVRDSSWDKAAQEYEQIFEWAKVDAPYCQ